MILNHNLLGCFALSHELAVYPQAWRSDNTFRRVFDALAIKFTFAKNPYPTAIISPPICFGTFDEPVLKGTTIEIELALTTTLGLKHPV